MIIETKADIIEIIEKDEYMMEILQTAKSLNLPDWWICAGFVRAKIWDSLHNFSERTTTADVDVIYFNAEKMDEREEKKWEQLLSDLLTDVPWSVKNEARMHVVNNIPPYTSSVDAISKFPETVTALGMKIDEDGKVLLTAPCGIDDLLNMQVKPTPYFKKTKERANIYEQRLREKNWQATWRKVQVQHLSPDKFIEE
ncbi:hypothetical protein CR194_19255 [Salipaludibacillus keqinensis]|uniref:Nucleotidyltransferase family protein n=1 Tax=Salipaludibacillus keqinensis TaxID=2045207 RepID=A0A323T6T4_9BACI|nr:nucleotidyltransferase family protein [Salipaludibacillus keqinensis]PYZ91761.1 hypothetical protein CR194_19255 [Salipaludibacillus keqinensis]